MPRIRKDDHPRILQMIEVEHLKVSDVAATFGCSVANIYALVGRLRREAAAAVAAVPVQTPLALEEVAPALGGEAELAVHADPLEAAGPRRRASSAGRSGPNAHRPELGGETPSLELAVGDEALVLGPMDANPTTMGSDVGPSAGPDSEIAGAAEGHSTAATSPDLPNAEPIAAPEELTAAPNVVAFDAHPPSTSGQSRGGQSRGGQSPGGQSPGGMSGNGKAGKAAADRRSGGPGGVGAKLAKPGYGLVMRTAEGEDNLTPFRSLDELLSAIRPILRAAARSPEPVWFSLQPIDLASVDMDAA